MTTDVPAVIRDLLIQAYTHEYFARINLYYSRGVNPSDELRINASKDAWKEAQRSIDIFELAHADLLKVLDPHFNLPSGNLTEDEKKKREKTKIDLGIILGPDKEKL